MGSDEHSVDRIIETLKSRGLRLTAIRRSILQILLDTDVPLTVSQLHAAVGKERADLATVYRTVHMFERVGVVERLSLGDGIARYVPAMESYRHRHYLICTECHRVVAVNLCCREWLDRAPPEGFVIQDHRLEILGICRQCSQRGSREQTGKGFS